MKTRQIIVEQIQSQMEQAAECVNQNQHLPAQIAFLECAKLCQQLELERQLEGQPEQKQITLDIEP